MMQTKLLIVMRASSIAGSEFPPRKMSSLQYFTVVRTAVLSKKSCKRIKRQKTSDDNYFLLPTRTAKINFDAVSSQLLLRTYEGSKVFVVMVIAPGELEKVVHV